MTFADLSPLANHLWQSTLCVAVAWLLTLALRKNRAAVRFWIWFAASAKFLLPFSLFVSAGRHLAWRAAPAIAPSQFSFAMETLSQPFAVPAATPMPAAAPTLNPVPAILLGVWLCGIAVGVVFWVRWWRQTRRLLRASTPLNLGLPIRVMSTTARLEPAVVGIFRPVLLLPAGIAEHLTPAQFEAIIAHELRHAERRDNLTAAIHMLVETVFWFHPLVWWIKWRLIEERERACDEGVLGIGSEPQVYAESILKVCEFYLASPAPCAAGVTGGELKKRIEAIMTNRFTRKLSCGKKMILALAAVLVISGPVLTGLLNPLRGRAQSRASLDTRTEDVGAPGLLAQTSAPLPSPESDPAKKAGGSTPTPAIGGQPASERPEFEVASVKPSDSRVGHIGILNDPGGRISANNLTLEMLISEAFHLPLSQISGGPAWIRKDTYAIEAKPAAASSASKMIPSSSRTPLSDEQRYMLQGLLADRFRLNVHHEIKEGPIYLLVKGGTALKLESPKDPSSISWAGSAAGGPVIGDGIVGVNISMPELAYRLSFSPAMMGRPVLDRTGITGSFDFTFKRPAAPAGTPPPVPGLALGGPASGTGHSDEAATSLRHAIAESLTGIGLRLDQGKGPVDTIVIDHAEKPSEN